MQQWRDDAQYFEHAGNRIAYWTTGRGRPLLLVHGFPTSSWDWTRLWNKIDGNKHTLIAADMLGFGMSDKPRQDYSIHGQADLQLAILNHFGITDYDALVHDYGCTVGQELLARNLEGSGAVELHRMVFLNGGIFPAQNRPPLSLRLADTPLGPIINRLLTKERLSRGYSVTFGPHTKPTRADLDNLWQMVCENDGRLMTHKLAHYQSDRLRHEERWVTVLKKVQDRIGLINGASDPVSGEHGFNRWVEYLPEAKIYLMPEIGHYPHVEAPDETARIVLEWLG